MPKINPENKKESSNSTKRKRCPNGTRKNKTTGECEKIVIDVPTDTINAMQDVVHEDVEDVPVEDVPIEDVPVEDVPVEDVPIEDVPIEGQKEVIESSEEENVIIFPESDEIEDDFTYPFIDDPDFVYKISEHKEFVETQYDGNIMDISFQSNFMCNAKFELAPHQSFVKNFLSVNTPYNSLLLYHMLGSGKTCSAIGIAEEMRSYLKQMGINKKIIVVASPNVQQNFKKQLFDERKLEQVNGKWFIERTCIGSELLKEINPTNMKGLTKGHIVQQIEVLIFQNYQFMGYIEFSNYMANILKLANANETNKSDIISKYFDDQLIIIDEVHNINILDSVRTNKRTAVNLLEIAKFSQRMRLLFLSATPMYNSPTEIIWLINLMNVNDKRPSIEPSEVFDKDGNFKEDGRELLRRKIIGYVSFVRGENPYLFPFRVYPDIFDQENSVSSIEYPKIQMNKREIREPLKHVPVYLNSVGEYQEHVYKYIIQSMTNKGQRKMPDFESMESFGYTLLYSPLESLVMVYPTEEMDFIIEKGEPTSSNPLNLIKKMIGKGGLKEIVDWDTDKESQLRYNFRYKSAIEKKYGRIFSPIPTVANDITSSNIYKYSAKIANICRKIRESTGIVLIYSQYIDGGVIPMALALEEMGFARYSSMSSHKRNLFKKSGATPLDWRMKTREELGAKSAVDFQQAKYVIITGDSNLSPNNNEDIKLVTNKENCDGKQVKVIIISKAASEGVDFRNIRQIHILQPWYNMNRIEQTIGRGVRNQSHCDLPFEKRNVEIYLHGTQLSNKEEEAADLYVYRMAEKKAKQIGQVTRLLKENAVDCILNIGQTNFTSEKLQSILENQEINIELSTGKIIEDFPVGDRPYSDLCDYMDNCEFKCAISPEYKDKMKRDITSTYSEDFLKTNSNVIIARIRDLYRDKNAFTNKQLIDSINIVKKYPIHHIYYAISKMIDNTTGSEELIDKYGRTGYLVNRGNIYAFQPSEITDEGATMYERTVPVDVKPQNLKFEISRKFNVMKEVTNSVKDVEIVQNQQDYDMIYNDIVQQLEYLTTPIQKISASEKNWFKHASKVVSILKDIHGIPIQIINKYALYHYLDVLDIDKKIIIANHFYGKENLAPKNELEENIRFYIEERILRKQGRQSIGLLLASTDSNVDKVYSCYEKAPGEDWILKSSSDFLAKDNYGLEAFRKYKVESERIFKETGFMAKFQKGDKTTMVFKIKTSHLVKINKGAVAEDASKKDSIIPKLNAVWGNDSYADSELKKNELCIILEMLMRFLTDASDSVIKELIPDRSANIVYFFGPEKSLFNKIWDK